MADVFRLADRVVAFLGPEADDSAYAIRLIKELSSKMEVDWLGYEVKWKEGHSMSQDTRYGKKEFCSFASLLERPWFERLWVRQEIRLAKPTAILVCGSTDLLWQRFRDAVFICEAIEAGKPGCLILGTLFL